MSLFSKIGRDASLQVNARADDFLRMSKLLTSYQGAKFLANQALLRASNFNGEDRESITKTAIDTAVDVSSVTASLLSQVAVNGTGTHFISGEVGFNLNGKNNSRYFTGNSNAATEAKYTGRVVVSRGSNRLPTAVKEEAVKSMSEMATGDDFHTFLQFAKDKDGEVLDRTVFLEDGMTEDNFQLATLVSKDTLPVLFSVVNETHSVLPFRGFVNGINDSFNANWNSINYVGRNEPLYIYDSTTRSLGFTLQIPIFSKNETRKVYQRVNALMSYMYGRYGDSGAVQGLNQGTVLKIRVGDYFRGYGIMSSLSHNIAQEVPWSSTAHGDGDDLDDSDRLVSSGKRDLILPQVITLQLSFDIIHERLPQRIVGEKEIRDYLPFIGVGVGSIEMKSEE